MTDTLIGLIPEFGLLLIFGVVALACLAVPLPASVLVLASGAFAASGDLQLWQVLPVTFAAFVLGDQIAFRLAGRVGPRLLGWFRARPRVAPVIAKSETLLDRRGPSAVLLSHTVLSPTCPYISYLCGAGGMCWAAFSRAAVIGAAIWSTFYVVLGYVFAKHLTQVASILSQFFGLALAITMIIFCLIWLRAHWKDHHRQPAPVDIITAEKQV